MGRTLQTPHFPDIYSHQIDSTLQNISIDFCLFTIPDYQLPITDYQLPITNSRLPITNSQFKITNYQFKIKEIGSKLT